MDLEQDLAALGGELRPFTVTPAILKGEHVKYVVDIRWSASGRFLATAAHDRTVLLYRVCR